jgi:hypothetical protein
MEAARHIKNRASEKEKVAISLNDVELVKKQPQTPYGNLREGVVGATKGALAGSGVAALMKRNPRIGAGIGAGAYLLDRRMYGEGEKLASERAKDTIHGGAAGTIFGNIAGLGATPKARGISTLVGAGLGAGLGYYKPKVKEAEEEKKHYKGLISSYAGGIGAGGLGGAYLARKAGPAGVGLAALGGAHLGGTIGANLYKKYNPQLHDKTASDENGKKMGRWIKTSVPLWSEQSDTLDEGALAYKPELDTEGKQVMTEGYVAELSMNVTRAYDLPRYWVSPQPTQMF